MEHAQRLARLEALLLAHQPLWQAQPFREARPGWCQQYPALTKVLLELDDAVLARLSHEPRALLALLSAHLPDVAELHALSSLTSLPQLSCKDPGPHFANHIPGRKWQQINAFASALDSSEAPLLEWCGGKGHLGRLLAWQHRKTVLTLERDDSLCKQGRQLAQHSGVAQHFEAVDVLSSRVGAAMAGRHAIALHACGELHRHLLYEAVARKVAALDIAPCCYHHLLPGDYVPLNPQSRLVLRRDDVRLAVTGAATAATRELRLRDQEMAWKLGYLLLLQRQGKMEYRPLRPIDKAWLREGFAGFCHRLAQREGDELPQAVNWQELEGAAWQRQRETMRLSLLRQGFARAIEVWLVLDLACYLERHGYRVRLGSFCSHELTPRNLMLSARYQGAGYSHPAGVGGISRNQVTTCPLQQNHFTAAVK